MKKKLYFGRNVIGLNKLKILIKNGKIREYYGTDFMGVMLYGSKYKLDKYATHYIDEEFKIEKVSKYDRKLDKIKANYKIDCKYLCSQFMFDPYIKLNIFEKLIIDFQKKESLFHKMKFSHYVVVFFCFTIPTILLTNKCDNKDQMNDQNKSPNPNSTINNQEIETDSTSADSISITIKPVDLGGLSE